MTARPSDGDAFDAATILAGPHRGLRRRISRGLAEAREAGWTAGVRRALAVITEEIYSLEDQGDFAGQAVRDRLEMLRELRETIAAETGVA